jgi:uncharacterized membrane protein
MNKKAILFSIVFLSVIDGVWIFSNKENYGRLVKNVQGTDMNTRLAGALVAYPLMFLGLVFIVFPLVRKDTETQNKLVLALKYGALFGLVIYGVYNATNYAIFKNYDAVMAIIDTLWGTFAYFLTTYATLLLFW